MNTKMIMQVVARALAVFFVAMIGPSLAAQNKISAYKILRHVERAGADQTVRDYYDKKQWPAILKGISGGTKEWLQVYLALRPAADGGAGEDLGFAISEALPLKPFMVLPLLVAETKSSATELCTFTFEAKNPTDGADSYLDKLERSLTKAKNDEERLLARSCRQGIQSSRVNIKSTQEWRNN